ncbi:hypothetical protein M409DRAFT_48439 [Zasmidium cellare ATCC 36951]|uniref:FAD-binding domain-containing protein n=1 Tax=Zasmidium cellare ATCC 36951 TaxID=1080233 RepID=A0A6A6D760_ZASCE|nr:uncharacterized protein M409DRAFT_48439 [Zasmidium cellare ATCC 36951]KAF2173466.1 hypothetical protein M409DRAFT_48439 [Zasmidium cellare ATCC 36951]
MDTYLDSVAVIGAGLGGCAIALALSQKHIPVTVYEARPASALSMQSGVLLTPNGLHVLDQLGVLPRIRDRCYIPTHRVFKNDNDEITKKDSIDSEEKYGYANHRIWRHFLLAEMRLMLEERSVPIHFDSKFNGVVSDTPHGVVFQINDTTQPASLLIASDGIYSAVRKYLAPDIHPSYTGITAVAGHARFDEIDWPDKTHPIDRNATFQSKAGAIFYIAEDPAGEEAMFATQAHFPEQSRQDLENLQASPERMLGFFTERYAEWGETARRIIDAVERRKESLFIWPFMRMPALPRWFSETGRIVLVGDGAHALPPSSAQGVNQALEDAWSLGLLLDTLRQQPQTKGTDEVEAPERLLLEVLGRWQKWRQGKIDEIFEWTENTTNVGRLAEGERRKLVEEGRVRDSHGDEMGWLFLPGIEKGVRGFFEG